MKKTIGVYAHVDAGKTTFCEALLHECDAIKKRGRVDNQDTVMDYHQIEKRRGITVFSDTAHFMYQQQSYQLLDTPGHADLVTEMEQTLPLIDVAILIINSSDGVQGHTLTLYRLLQKHKIPIYFFINKLDNLTGDLTASLDSLKQFISPAIYYLHSPVDLKSNEFIEWLCNFDEHFMEAYFENCITSELVRKTCQKLIAEQKIYLALGGSALKQTGVIELMEVLDGTILKKTSSPDKDFGGYVYKVIFDEKKERVTLLKVMSGELKIKQALSFGESIEKINDIRVYSGLRYQSKNSAKAGDIVGVTGLKSTHLGMGIGEYRSDFIPNHLPMMRVTLKGTQDFDPVFYQNLNHLEDQIPLLTFDYPSDSKNRVYVSFMGKIQLEIFQEILEDVYHSDVSFEDYTILYRETIANSVIGLGHYEPLGHYAYIKLKIEPSQTEGLTFSSDVHIEQLSKQTQNIIEASLFSRVQKGVLTGSPITKVHITLLEGKVSMIHTSKGDTREATWRAIRQGLEQAVTILLEPWYSFEIIANLDYMGNILSDLQRLNCRFLPPEIKEMICIIKGEGPVSKLVDYPEELASLTKGKGSVHFEFYDYLPCLATSEVVKKIGYQKERDLDYPSSSILFKKGAGYEVKWFEMSEHYGD